LVMLQARRGRYYEPVQKNAGWIFERVNSSNAKLPFFLFPNIGFVRYKNDEGEEFDAIANINFDKYDHRHFIFSPADQTKRVQYSKKDYYVRNYQGDRRFNFSQTQIINMETGNMAATFTTINYDGWWPNLLMAHKSCDSKVLPTNPRNEMQFRSKMFNPRSMQ